MFKRDKVYRTVETITLVCYAIGLTMACITGFIPFILLTLAAYPISFKTINKSGKEQFLSWQK